MRKLLVVVSLTTLPFTALLSAQEVKTVPPPKPRVVSEPTKKPLLKRIFGGKGEAAPAPAPAPAPAVTAEKPAPKPVADATPKPKPKPRAKSQADSKPSTSKKTAGKKPTRGSRTVATEKKEEEKPAETAAEKTKPAGEPETATNAKGGKKPEKPATEGLDDTEKYKVARATALEDAAIKDLKAKADGAINESEAHAASVAYNRALFRKIREIEPSLDGYVDKLETAMMKRLSGEKNGE